MKASPCLDCPLREEDKNNNVCRVCPHRISYVRGLERQLEFTACYPGDASHVVHIVN